MKDIKRNTRFKKISNRRFGKERSVPVLMILKIWFSDVLNIMGGIFFFSSIPFVLIFVPVSTLLSPSLPDSAPSTKGKITEVHATHTTVNGVPVYKYVYEYSLPDGGHYGGTGYNSGQVFREGAPITVKYKSRQPEKSSVDEFRESSSPVGIGLVVLVFPLVGLAMLFFGTRKAVNSIRILKIGKLAYGKFLNKTPTHMIVNDQTVYKLTFEFTANDGRVYEAIAKTHKYGRLQDEAEEQLVYDPEAPERAVMLDALPKAVKKYLAKQ